MSEDKSELGAATVSTAGALAGGMAAEHFKNRVSQTSRRAHITQMPLVDVIRNAASQAKPDFQPVADYLIRVHKADQNSLDKAKAVFEEAAAKTSSVSDEFFSKYIEMVESLGIKDVGPVSRFALKNPYVTVGAGVAMGAAAGYGLYKALTERGSFAEKIESQRTQPSSRSPGL
jgi:phage-related tail protein